MTYSILIFNITNVYILHNELCTVIIVNNEIASEMLFLLEAK